MLNPKELTSYSLYHYESCPFCSTTKKALRDTDLNGLKITKKDILSITKFRSELIKGGGKLQVPCLKIENSLGHSKWLYESNDIIRYFNKISINNQTLLNL